MLCSPSIVSIQSPPMLIITISSKLTLWITRFIAQLEEARRPGSGRFPVNTNLLSIPDSLIPQRTIIIFNRIPHVSVPAATAAIAARFPTLPVQLTIVVFPEIL